MIAALEETLSPVAARAREALEKTGGVVQASRLLEEWARRDSALRLALTEPWLARACYDAVRGVCREDRRAIWTAPNYTKDGNGQRVSRLSESLLDFRLPSGKPLRDATRDDLLAASAFYREQAEDMAHKSRWLEAIAKRIGPKTVGEVLDDVRLAKMKEAASA